MGHAGVPARSPAVLSSAGFVLEPVRALRSAFPGSSERTVNQFARIAGARGFSAGQTVFRQGDPSDWLLIVITGRVAISLLSAEGAEVLLDVIDPAGVVGEVGLLDGGPRSANATALRDTRALVLMRRDLLPLLDTEPSAARALYHLLCARLRRTTSLVEDALLLPLGARLLHRVQALARAYGRVEVGSSDLRIDHGLSQQGLGDSIGASRVSVNKQLNAWRAQGLLGFGRGFIVIHDMPRLEAAAESRPPVQTPV